MVNESLTVAKHGCSVPIPECPEGKEAAWTSFA